jgi:hypothetical protein
VAHHAVQSGFDVRREAADVIPTARRSTSGLAIQTQTKLKSLLGTALVLLPVITLAHHALQSEFEINKPSRRWTGTLKSVQWVNPHSHFILDVTNESGKVTTWSFETAAPNGLRRAGFSKSGFFEVGKSYTVIGYPARDGSAIAFVEQITLPDGRTVRIWFGDPNGSN